MPSFHANLPSLHPLHFIHVVSKSAQKNRRKKQQQQHARQQEATSGRSQEQRDAVSVTTHLMAGTRSEGGGVGDGDTEKKIKNLKKVNLWSYPYSYIQ